MFYEEFALVRGGAGGTKYGGGGAILVCMWELWNGKPCIPHRSRRNCFKIFKKKYVSAFYVSLCIDYCLLMISSGLLGQLFLV